ncbi:TOR signalling pathway regulator, putative [Candida dubliniensis CD36]|uniref:Type 2A phosphatase-associated protein, putative n=1 Tax=Candida dubliniensis (strain CD36 / ATCC MYA-646 / CBS 7987 / NCPF 3949 / NRRL Y-17841) TaxID=573826 RepID=B9WFL9_CANDC|nr:TOR signalling pathway regulator, putative [Candida dubliniensis CD36]CAX42038.1 TOR signalling pathway regulator, putative [Candida dubliniensis CD36]
MEQLTVAERYKLAIQQYENLQNISERQDSVSYQNRLTKILSEFQLVLKLVEQLSLFSDNERIEEISTNYIPFLNLWYYIGELYTKLLMNKEGIIDLDYKSENLQTAKQFIFTYLENLTNYDILTLEQSKKFTILRKGQSYELSAMNKRQEKIDNFKKEQELLKKLSILNSKDDDINKFDEEIIRTIYLDQLKFFILKSFNLLESINMELQVLKNRPLKNFNSSTNLEINDSRLQTKINSKRDKDKDDEYGFTTKLESLPKLSYQVSDLINKSGKILQPFTITSQKQNLKEKVFGTGQVLPSMTVEEYLDYELANGKMLKNEVKDKPKNDDNDSDTEDSEVEEEKRRWDDWKDDNPKGSGNMKANIG